MVAFYQMKRYAGPLVHKIQKVLPFIIQVAMKQVAQHNNLLGVMAGYQAF